MNNLIENINLDTQTDRDNEKNNCRKQTIKIRCHL